MIKLWRYETLRCVEMLRAGDTVLCKWKLDIRDGKGENKRRESCHIVKEIKHRYKEVILEYDGNIYFSMEMFAEGTSNLQEICRVIYD